MSKAWIRAKRSAFVRDVLRDFCMASKLLEGEFAHYEQAGELHFEALRDLLGYEMNKGLLWRLKDTAHHLFRNDPKGDQVGLILDWALGYVFHETIKLKEDAYQQTAYGAWARRAGAQAVPAAAKALAALEPEAEQPAAHGAPPVDGQAAVSELFVIVGQTRESITREVARVRFILTHCRSLFPAYLSQHRENDLLARLLFEDEDLVRNTFGENYGALLRAVYGDLPELLYVHASRSLRNGGWLDDAVRALRIAAGLAPASALVAQEQEIIDAWRKRLTA